MFVDDSRSERRYACQAQVMGASTIAFAGTVTDLSSAGLCLVTSTPMEPGRQLHLDFVLPQGRVEAVGEVRRVDSGEGGLQLGIRFVRISADSLEVIRQATTQPPGPSIVRTTSPR
jgi:hypothetical protein